MPVRNAAPYLDAAVRSILAQTTSDFEYVVVDDASTDGSSDLLAAWAARDSRLRILRSDTPLGLAGSSDAAVRASRAPLVARMDGDDLAHPERLARQLAVFERADVALVGTAFDGIDANGQTVRSGDRWRLLRPSAFAPFPHGSIMFRRAAFEAAGGYRPRTDHWEDLDLCRRLAAQGRVMVLPEVLYHYRFHAANTCTLETHASMVRTKARMFAAVDRRRRGQPGAPEAGQTDAASDPHLLYSIAASQIWAGHNPQLWRRLHWSMLASADPRVPVIFGVAGAAAVSPRATRFLLASVILCRDWIAGLRVGRDPWEWHFES
jgi:glycosyltransferase involved in cell wall biosynthesis